MPKEYRPCKLGLLDPDETGYFSNSEYKRALFILQVLFTKKAHKLKGRGLIPRLTDYLNMIMMILSTIIKMLKTLIKFIILSFQPQGQIGRDKPNAIFYLDKRQKIDYL